MDIAATVTSKGQVTIPRRIREAMNLHAGDKVVFRVHEGRATLTRTPDLLDLAGVVPVPPDKRGADWETIREETRRQRGRHT